MSVSVSHEQEASQEAHHPTPFDPKTFVVVVLVSFLGSIIGIHMITTLGVSPETSVIGALVAMILARISVLGLRKLRNVHRQNLVQSAMSGSTFAAANAILTPLAIVYLFGEKDLVWPMFVGAIMGLSIDVWVLYHAFGSSFLPATGAWPDGVAAAETIKAGDKGGKRSLVLVGGGVFSLICSFFGLPISASGAAMIGNIGALTAFGVGLLVNQFAPNFLGGATLSSLYIPHGVMIGAGLVALIQAVLTIRSHKKKHDDAVATVASEEHEDLDPSLQDTVSPEKLQRALTTGFILFLCGAVILAAITGVIGKMSVPALLGWILFAAFGALVHELIVGVAAMQSGWFPAFAVTLIILILGLVFRIPAMPLAVLVGYCASTGPTFADMGYDFKAGWVLRRDHRPYTAFELEGRRQQLHAAIIGFAVAMLVVAVLWKPLFTQGLVPPTAQVFADTIKVGLSDPSVIRTMLLWAILGAALQIAGTAKHQLGVMAATGLLISTQNAGFLVLLALIIRLIWRKVRGHATGESETNLFGAGLIAGDSIFTVGSMFF